MSATVECKSCHQRFDCRGRIPQGGIRCPMCGGAVVRSQGINDPIVERSGLPPINTGPPVRTGGGLQRVRVDSPYAVGFFFGLGLLTAGVLAGIPLAAVWAVFLFEFARSITP